MIVAAYIAEGNFKGLRPGDAERLTHVNFSFAVVRDGKGSVAHWKNSDAVREFTRNKGHIKAILSVGGWGAGGFSPAVATPESREIFAQSLVDIVNDYGFDGIDMDWEYPCDGIAGIEYSPEDKPNYTALTQLLRDKMGPDKIVSMAAGAMQSCVESLELDKLVKLMDFINIMTYDMCPWDSVNYHTALYTSDTAKNRSGHHGIEMYEKAGVPRDKLTLGCAFYARIYRGVDGHGAPAEGPPGFSGGYADTMTQVEAAGGLQYDAQAEAPYAYDAKEKAFITFDNPRSLKAKMAYVKETGLAGIMFWEYSCDDENSTLLKNLVGCE